MNNQAQQPTYALPSYITSATPLGNDKRAPWFKNIAPTYACHFGFWAARATTNQKRI
jgi:hypothetical protein